MRFFKRSISSLAMAAAAMLSVGQARAELLLVDDFSGTSLAPQWTLDRGYAVVNGGFLDLFGSTPGGATRDGYVYAALADPSWADYHLTTRFVTDGGRTSVSFRVQTLGPSGGWGSFYGVGLQTSDWSDGPSWFLQRDDLVGGSLVSRNLAGGALDASFGFRNGSDNVLDILASGNQFRVLLNGRSLTADPIVDPYPNPHLYGGVSLQSVWEEHTHFDYVTVGTLPVPEPATSAMLMFGLALVGCGVLRQGSKLR